MAEHFDKFQEYKFFAESTQYLSERRQAATQTYLSVNTAIIAVIGFIIKESGHSGWGLISACLALVAAGVVACAIWYKIIKQYKDLIGWRYDQLMAMEKLMPDCHQMYTNEWHQFFEPRMKIEKFGFSRLEIWLPRLFLWIYLVYSLALITLKFTKTI